MVKGDRVLVRGTIRGTVMGAPRDGRVPVRTDQGSTFNPAVQECALLADKAWPPPGIERK